MSQILGLKFRDYGQIYYFSSGPYVVKPGDHVLVKTDQGLGMAQVADIPGEPPKELPPDDIKPIYRLANEEDLETARDNETMAREAYRYCRECIRDRELDMKLVDVEVFHDRGKIIFYFTAPGRIDFRELVKDLVKNYHTRIELRQIGVRHETQMLGAIGNCGQTCCCRRFMRKFAPVTIKMAKEQNLFLNPAKISGMCGRLLCCLNFEQGNYDAFQRKCPKIGKRLDTTLGAVKILRTNLFRETVSVLTETGEEKELTLPEWQEISKGVQSPAQAETGAGPRAMAEDYLAFPPTGDMSPPTPEQTVKSAPPRHKNVPSRTDRPDPRGKRPPKKRFPPRKDDPAAANNRPAQEHRQGPRKPKTREGSE
ncbi:MAG: regulatory iron-sulfur-containing complex subunit RicT [Desulfovibrionaceae bacterium]|nr:regulatory iron-sulfur-containing complex subunit RicT [Desulfovibrionaceae bacterium]